MPEQHKWFRKTTIYDKSKQQITRDSTRKKRRIKHNKIMMIKDEPEKQFDLIKKSLQNFEKIKR